MHCASDPDRTLEGWAAAEAERMLSPLGDRWKHVRAVGGRARRVGVILDQEDRRYLVAAAYLHDIGYAPELQRTGLHQLDGARYIEAHWAMRLARLVAHHSEARFEIRQATPYLVGAIARTEDRLRGFGCSPHHAMTELALTRPPVILQAMQTENCCRTSPSS